jgi:NADH:ubiquinone oxidoreductase subunit C
MLLIAKKFTSTRLGALGAFENNLLTVHSHSYWLQIVGVLLYFNSGFNFKAITDLIVSDLIGKAARFLLKYVFLSNKFFNRIFLSLVLKEQSFLESLTCLYSGIGWLEREVFDLFGIVFKNNLDLRRILLDYGFDGHPLRKDFPLTGYWDLYYDDVLMNIQHIPLMLAQSWRNFYFYKI